MILLRDSDDGLQTLMIHRGSTTAFGGMWAFPGGTLDAEDIAPGGLEPASRDPLPAARRAAVRETAEEVGLHIDADDLVYWSHWLPPADAPRRYSTWFFVAPAPDHGTIAIDGGEVANHAWAAPATVLAAHRQGQVELAPPTFVTLVQLAAIPTTADALELEAEPIEFKTQMIRDSAGTMICLYDGDIAYGTSTPDVDGPRHRIVMTDGDWRYERSTPDRYTVKER